MNHGRNMRATITAPQRRLLETVIDAQIRDFERCRARLRYVDPDVFAAGMELFSSASALAQWLCEPAPSLNYKTPLSVLRSAKGRTEVTHILRAIGFGNVL